ncbi:hypothetical protein AB0E63_42860 [Kribbella sp. NPDC026596]|jgi:hypothetical protein|uniref:hypothetical protein n=1 Tax=Kribbella sp. NPDC026596 TaxID=3155122 RepID=UPI0033E0B4F1
MTRASKADDGHEWRQLFDDWIRAMTIFGEPWPEPEEKVAMIAAVNQPGKISINLRGPLSEHDQQALAEGLAAMNTIRSRQAWLNQVIELQLIVWWPELPARTTPRSSRASRSNSDPLFHPTHRADTHLVCRW